jgi:hypothetical protein
MATDSLICSKGDSVYSRHMVLEMINIIEHQQKRNNHNIKKPR